ncbi:hypothetical protein DRN73_01825 [Candidatus Pacearchaeota archaeon]|nr:MAG: hypothetical protein DRN73_01825 [Candidatus Pacearchaeota archaeon]
MIKKFKYLSFILILLTINFENNLKCIEFNILKNVIYLKKPTERVIFEFKDIPKYDIVQNGTKIKLTFFHTYPGENTFWLSTLPKEVFKEINVALQNTSLILEFEFYKKLNFQLINLENKLVLNLIWKPKKIPVKITIKGKKVIKEFKEGANNETLMFSKYEFPHLKEYKKFKMPFTQKEYKGTPISVDFQNADLHAVLRLLAEVGGINIVVSERAKGAVTLKLHQVPWDQVLDIVLANHGLGMIELGNVIRIAPMDEVKEEATKYQNYLTSLKYIEEQGPLVTKLFHLKYIKADAIIDRIKEILTAGRTYTEGTVTYESYSNILIVKTTEKNVAEIEKIIKEIDKPTKQVLIEARIIEIQDTYAYKLGIKWGSFYSNPSEHSLFNIAPSTTSTISYGSSSGGVPIPSLELETPDTTAVDLGVTGSTNLGFLLGHFRGSTALLDMQLSALEEEGVARVFSTPKIITLDNQDAEIKQGYKVPYLRLTPEGVPTTEFIEAVLRLKVTPHVTPDNRISLDVELEKSTPDWSRVVQGQPAVSTRYAKTRVLINSGDTLVIGGIKTNNIGESIGKVPGLSKIPGISELFKKREKDWEKTELIVFITPKIISVEIPEVDY